ncbi:hypothetical protein L915_07315 [Phytophthora nicotianae]|uniref:DDE-1 domain-containing protein n=1 Tax=Phytophthora nicotianae TaxID=4792 RepID=W2GZP0_PHYNI|nr:hypothetical protein L915_07315 [Phytophthora nicotianae]ETL41830.1 hypothetical protein L916_07256 [Phytophthora nicotianae]
MVIPHIKEVWPSSKRVALQRDNAKPHVAVDDPEVAAACSLEDWDMKIISQPANSPDFNANDLGFFNSLQSLQLKNALLTLQSVLQASMSVDSCNKYAIPHLSKDKLRVDTGLLLPSLACGGEVHNKSKPFLSSVK